MKFQLLDTVTGSPQANMAKDVELLANLTPYSEPLVHLYDWEGDSLTHGHFIPIERFLTDKGFETLSVARRPTGGGILFHKYDFTFSFLIPKDSLLYSYNTLESYHNINQVISTILTSYFGPKFHLQGEYQKEKIDFCMAKPTVYDLLCNGKKVGGAAQRKTEGGILHQGSLLLFAPVEEHVVPLLQNGEEIFQSMLSKSSALFDRYDLKEKELFKEFFKNTVKNPLF